MTNASRVAAYRKGVHTGESFRGSPGGLPVAPPYDVGFFVSSWEERSTVVTRENIAVSTAGHVRFVDEGDGPDNGGPYTGLNVAYDQAVAEFVRARSRTTVEIAGNPSDLHGIANQITNVLYGAYAEAKRPLSVFMDITCCPKYYTLTVLGEVLQGRLGHVLDFYYAEGRYEDTAKREGPFMLTDGTWEPAVVPSLRGQYDPEKRRFVLASLGHEGERAFRLISRYEPDRVTVLRAEPGFNEGHSREVARTSKAIIAAFGASDIKAHAGDAVAAWKVLEEKSGESPDAENLVYMCLGTKPHALALGLKAYTAKSAAVVYNNPSRFLKRNAVFEKGCRSWLYRIRDLAVVVPPAS